MRLPPLITAVARRPAGASGRAPAPGGVAAADCPDPLPAADGRLYSHWVLSNDIREARQTFQCPAGKFWCPCADDANRGRYVCCSAGQTGGYTHCDCSHTTTGGHAAPCTGVASAV